ncbi:MAG: RHS repeat-associated core domain-containing protein, partial [bacterium]|nr:RHS repeat-associated core domain-containing protein [bacterium]
FGGVRLDEKTGAFSEQKKFTGKDLDKDTGLYYYGARYYDGRVGRFTGIDGAFLAIGESQKFKEKYQRTLQQHLSNPQALNSYSYVNNNPLRYNDPNGEWFKELITGQQSWSNFVVEAGDAAQTLYDNNGAARAAMDHPVAAGVVAGAGGGMAAYGAAAGVAYLSATYLGGAGTACVAFCGKAGQAGLSEYNTAVNWITNRGVGVSSLPSQSEIQSVMNKWSNTNFDSKTQAILYHFNEHADGVSLQKLTQNGLNIWNQYANNSSLVKSVSDAALKDGSAGITVRLTTGAGGIFTKGGEIVSTWFK